MSEHDLRVTGANGDATVIVTITPLESEGSDALAAALRDGIMDLDVAGDVHES